MVALLLTYAPPWLPLIAGWCLMSETPRGQPWTPALMLPHGCYGPSVRRMTVLGTFRRPSMYQPVHYKLMRSALLDVTTIVPATPCHHRNYIESYSKCSREILQTTRQAHVQCHRGKAYAEMARQDPNRKT